MEGKNHRAGAAVTVITYLVGAAGFAVPVSRPLFLWLVPFHLLLVCGILLWLHRPWNAGFVVFVALSYLISFSAEYAGVHTALLFGHYHYGEALGAKFRGIPLMIGINWMMLTYASCSVAAALPVRPWVRAAFSALVLTAADFIMEPAAVELGFWTWHTPYIPVFNYACWFLLAFMLSWLAYALRVRGNFSLSLAVLLCQAVFFLSLQIV